MTTQKPYADECKQEAVKLVTEQGMSVTQVARDLGISLDTLHRWLRAARSATNPVPATRMPPVELARLRRENEQLCMERAMLKKGLGTFSRMPQ